MLGSFEYSYGIYLSDVAYIFKRYDESDEKEKEKDKIKYIQMIFAKSKPHVINDDVSKKLTIIRDNVVEDINNLFKNKNKRRREEDIIIENNNKLNMRDKDNNSSSSSSSSSSLSSIILTSHSKRDFLMLIQNLKMNLI
jgi:hypothetical protein